MFSGSVEPDPSRITIYPTQVILSGASATGGLFLWGWHNFRAYQYDNVPQKIWLVKSSDVNCNLGKMTAWHPTEYLFEWDVI